MLKRNPGYTWVNAKGLQPKRSGVYLVRIQSRYGYAVARWDAEDQCWYSIGRKSNRLKSVKMWREIPQFWE